LCGRRPADRDLVERALERGELLIVELRDEEFANPPRMHRGGLQQARQAIVRQRDDDPSTVDTSVDSTHETPIGQVGDSPGHARPRDECPDRELSDAQLAARTS